MRYAVGKLKQNRVRGMSVSDRRSGPHRTVAGCCSSGVPQCYVIVGPCATHTYGAARQAFPLPIWYWPERLGPHTPKLLRSRGSTQRTLPCVCGNPVARLGAIISMNARRLLLRDQRAWAREWLAPHAPSRFSSLLVRARAPTCSVACDA